MWRVSLRVIRLAGSSLLRTRAAGSGQGDAHVTPSCGRWMAISGGRDWTVCLPGGRQEFRRVVGVCKHVFSLTEDGDQNFSFLIKRNRPTYCADTIHALIEENMHLHDQLENLTQALQKLKQLLWNHSEETRNEHDPDLQRLRNEWMQHGVGAETHRLLEHVFCEHDLHTTASSSQAHSVLLLITLMYLSFLLF